MLDLYRRYKLIIWTVLIALITSIIAVVLYNTFVFRVVNSTPSNNGKLNIGQSAIILNFNKELEKIDPNTQISSVEKILIEAKVDDKKLVIYVNNIKAGQKYTVEVKNIKSKSGDIIGSYKISFVGKYLTYDEMSSEAKKVAEDQTDKSSLGIPEDPVMKILPKYTSQYSLNYLIYDQPSQKGKYIQIKAILFVPDEDINNPSVVLSYKNKVLEYFKSNNINPNNYVIEWNPASAANL